MTNLLRNILKAKMYMILITYTVMPLNNST